MTHPTFRPGNAGNGKDRHRQDRSLSDEAKRKAKFARDIARNEFGRHYWDEKREAEIRNQKPRKRKPRKRKPEK